ncbi:hypothetical protein [Tahibacter aquaticus]|uniref:hypothetical protein n=1 Tax=Tahibacter aquaticus TaxID=520092 RepID=UPI00105DA4C9|nr:hypothetical protein [Tahibacter aquaticus]
MTASLPHAAAVPAHKPYQSASVAIRKTGFSIDNQTSCHSQSRKRQQRDQPAISGHKSAALIHQMLHRPIGQPQPKWRLLLDEALFIDVSIGNPGLLPETGAIDSFL